MLRIRIDGGADDAEQLRSIAWVSERYGRDVADITDRQNVQLHWIRIEDVPDDLRAHRSRGAVDAGSLRRHPARHPGVPARGRHRRRGARRHARDPRGGRALPRRPGVLEPAAQVQDLDQRMQRAVHEPRDQRHVVRGRHRPGRRRPATTCTWAAGCPPTRCSRSVWAPSWNPTASPRCGPASPGCSASTATAARATTRGSSSW